MKNHPLADIFPMMDGPAFNRLVEDVRAHGLRDPVVVHDGMILDGRNRAKACADLGITPATRAFTGDDPLAFVISVNLHRRHLTESQRAMIAERLANMPQGYRSDREPSPNPGKVQPVSTEKAAKMLNVGRGTVETARFVRKRGTPEQIAAVERGEKKVSAVAEEIRSASKTRPTPVPPPAPPAPPAPQTPRAQPKAPQAPQAPQAPEALVSGALRVLALVEELGGWDAMRDAVMAAWRVTNPAGRVVLNTGNGPAVGPLDTALAAAAKAPGGVSGAAKDAARAALPAVPDEPPKAWLALSKQEQYDRALAAGLKRLERDFQQRVEAGVVEYLEREGYTKLSEQFSHAAKHLGDQIRRFDSFRRPIPAKVFKQLMAAVHPDRNSGGTDASNEAFAFLQDKRPVLCDDTKLAGPVYGSLQAIMQAKAAEAKAKADAAKAKDAPGT